MTGAVACALCHKIKVDFEVQKSTKAMQLNRESEYAIRALAALARHAGQGACPLQKVCAAEGLPRSLTAKVFARLARRGIVRASRGVRGGYRLARPAAQVRLWDLVVAVDGPSATAGCLFWRKACSEATCPIVACHVAALRRQALALLKGTTLADLLAGVGRPDLPSSGAGSTVSSPAGRPARRRRLRGR